MVGAPLQGRVLVIDDVITAGTAIRESVEIIRAEGAELAAVAIAIDRQERGNSELSAIQEVEQALGARVLSVVSLDDVIGYLREEDADSERLSSIENYRKVYGVVNN